MMQTRQDFNTNLDSRLWCAVIMSYYQCKKKKKSCYVGCQFAIVCVGLVRVQRFSSGASTSSITWSTDNLPFKRAWNMRFVHHYCHNIEVEWHELLQIAWAFSYDKHASALWSYIPWNPATAAPWELMPLLPSPPRTSTWRERPRHLYRAFVTANKQRTQTVCFSFNPVTVSKSIRSESGISLSYRLSSIGLIAS